MHFFAPGLKLPLLSGNLDVIKLIFYELSLDEKPEIIH